MSLYLLIGAGVFFVSRLSHDYSWDRYFHVYYPASMEFFDVFTAHYANRLQYLSDNLPSSFSELLPEVTSMPISKRASKMVKEEPGKLVQEEADLAAAFIQIFDSQQNATKTVDKKLEELVSALDSSLTTSESNKP